MKIALSTDHAGMDLLKKLKAFLTEQGHECGDFGPTTFDPADDYPDFIFPAAKAVASGEYECGIIMGGSGQGEAMAANRVKGIRCTLFYGPALPKEPIDAEGNMSHDDYEILRLSREHNLANMLSLGARFLSWDEVEQAANVWLGTAEGTVERHQRRAAKLDQ
jgi:ribose 5-phosphate isomerase B